MLIIWIIIFSLLGSIISVLGAALLLYFYDSVRNTLLPSLISYATGTLLGAAFLGMLPRALEQNNPDQILGVFLFGIILFFMLEKLVLWRHCHDQQCEIHGTAGHLILLGDALHNFIDGVVITATFLVSIPFGIATALAVIAHEVPQEIGDFAILLECGFSKKKAFIYNLLSSITTLPGAIIAYIYLKEILTAIPYILALSASSFMYSATADLIPMLHKKSRLKENFLQLALVLAGIGTIFLFKLSH